MPKGRCFAPQIQNDGIWFQHRGMGKVDWPPNRATNTSTAIQQTAPFNEYTARYPPAPPRPYTDKQTEKDFKLSNNFSCHDNRNSFQDHGVYFGNGRDTRTLGKYLTPGEKRLHYTEKDYLKHNAPETVDYDYRTQYRVIHSNIGGTEPARYRRFPKQHPEGASGRVPLDTVTTDWFPEECNDYKTPTHLLGTSLQPLLPHNPWKYSNRKMVRCYPPYDRPELMKQSVWKVNGPSYIKQIKSQS